MDMKSDPLLDAITILRTNRLYLQAQGIASIIIFGSTARSEDRANSDIDLLIRPSAGLIVGGLQLSKWKILLSGLLGRKADVVVEEFLDERVKANLVQDMIDVW